eukprot:28437-Chlamydomonas_euryale.AAC.5
MIVPRTASFALTVTVAGQVWGDGREICSERHVAPKGAAKLRLSLLLPHCYCTVTHTHTPTLMQTTYLPSVLIHFPPKHEQKLSTK